MSFFPPPREIRRRLPLVAVAFILTHLPALTLLILGTYPGGAGFSVYIAATAVTFLGVVALGLAWTSRARRMVTLVREYAEEGKLAQREERHPDSNVEEVKASLVVLDRAMRRLESDAARDPLTGLLNRRTCAARLEGDLARSYRSGIPFSIAIFDLDDLKSINDVHGHAAGDAALKRLAQVLQGVVREGDWVARWGGDEFLLGLWDADATAAAAVAGRVIRQLADDATTALGVSVGVGQALPEDEAARIFSRADKALFESKRNGRGQVSLS